MSLTKAHIVDDIQKRVRHQRGKIVDIVETLLEIMKESMANGEDVLISGFGKFSILDKKARKGRNPATGKSMILPARRVVTFKCSVRLRDKVNGIKKAIF